jgi:predicted dehydrogenase
LTGARRAAVAACHPGSRVEAAADLEVGRAKEVAAATRATAVASWEEVIRHPRVDLVVVATPHDRLAPITIAALRAGKHVLCEKPMSVNSQQAREVFGVAETSRGRLQVGFNHRYHPGIRRAGALLAAGEIGAPLFIRCRYGHGGRPGYEREWRMDPLVSGGGELLDQGIHAIDLFRVFLGDLTQVSGMVATLAWEAPVEDNVFALFRSSSGCVASLHASWTQWKNLFSFEIFGERGALIVEGLGKSYGTERLTVYRRHPGGGVPDEETTEFPGPDESWDYEWREFLAAIRAAREPAVPAAAGVAALELVEAVSEAARSGRTVRVEPSASREDHS